MDFKVAGTRDGITALQMDIKIDGINREILKELSKENLESIEEYDGGKIIKEFENYFNECLK